MCLNVHDQLGIFFILAYRVYLTSVPTFRLIPFPLLFPQPCKNEKRKDDSSVGFRHRKPVSQEDREAGGVPRGAKDGRFRRGGRGGHAGATLNSERSLCRARTRGVLLVVLLSRWLFGVVVVVAPAAVLVSMSVLVQLFKHVRM